MIDDFMLDPLPTFDFELPEFDLILPEFDPSLLCGFSGDAARGRGETRPCVDFWRGVRVQIEHDTSQLLTITKNGAYFITTKKQIL